MEEDNIIVKWAQEDVGTSYSLVNNNKSEVTISMFVSVKIDGLGKVWKTDVVNFDSFWKS